MSASLIISRAHLFCYLNIKLSAAAAGCTTVGSTSRMSLVSTMINYLDYVAVDGKPACAFPSTRMTKSIRSPRRAVTFSFFKRNSY